MNELIERHVADAGKAIAERFADELRQSKAALVRVATRELRPRMKRLVRDIKESKIR